MNILIITYIINATLLLLHEIESAYEKEWELLKLPGSITGFLLMHVPIIIFLFYGALEIYNGTFTGIVTGIITGICGIIPFLVHKVFVSGKDHFNLVISNIIIYLNILTGLLTAVLSINLLL